MGMLISWLVNGLSIFIAAYLLPGVDVKDLSSALIVAIVLALLNTFIKPILVILTLPITVITLGLFSIVINALLILMVDYLVPGFSVSGIISALIFSVVVSIISSILSSIAK